MSFLVWSAVSTTSTAFFAACAAGGAPVVASAKDPAIPATFPRVCSEILQKLDTDSTSNYFSAINDNDTFLLHRWAAEYIARIFRYSPSRRPFSSSHLPYQARHRHWKKRRETKKPIYEDRNSGYRVGYAHDVFILPGWLRNLRSKRCCGASESQYDGCSKKHLDFVIEIVLECLTLTVNQYER